MKWLNVNKLDIFNDIICIPFQEDKTSYLQMVKNRLSVHFHFTFVSDEVKDLMQAHEAGFSSIGVAWGFDTVDVLQQANPKAIIAKSEDFLSILSDKVQAIDSDK